MRQIIHKLIEILSEAKRLRRKAALYEQLNLLLAEPNARIDDLQPMLAALTSRSFFGEEDRTVATRVAALANWSADQRSEICVYLSTAIEKETRSKKPGKLLFRWFCRGMILSMVFWTGCAALSGMDDDGPGYWDNITLVIISSAILTVVGSFITAPLSLWYDNRYSTKLVSAVELLGRLGNGDAIAAMAAALTIRPLRAVAAQVLPDVVSKLTPDDYGSVHSAAGLALCLALPKVGAETGLVILKALTFIGDGRAIYAVEVAAHTGASYELRVAALDLIPILNKRVSESRANTMLLRASSPLPLAEQTLLRAAHGAGETHEEELLRAGSE